MNEPTVAFTPAPPDPRLEELDEEIATLIAEALARHILRKGLLKRPGIPVDSKSTQT